MSEIPKNCHYKQLLLCNATYVHAHICTYTHLDINIPTYAHTFEQIQTDRQAERRLQGKYISMFSSDTENPTISLLLIASRSM